MDHEVIQNWGNIQQILKTEFDIKEQMYRAFLANLKPSYIQDKLIVIEVDDSGYKSLLESRYYSLIKFAINMALDKDYEISFQIKSQHPKEIVPKQSVISSSYDNNEDRYHLNKRYTFENFVVGNNNQMANAAALAVAESPSNSYNPLFIYGGVGLGKTHLMHAIAHYILENHHLKVLYVSSETFTNELIQSIHSKKNEEFRKKYRNIDVLLVDDIQFISGKESTQEEFFHTFNTLHEAKKQIIISSDRPPKDIETLEERLRSRFSGGLIVDVQSPDFETRMAILKNKADFDDIDIDHEVLEYIANNVKSNIRELEGAVNKIIAFNNYNNNRSEKITMQIAEEALKDSIINASAQLINPNTILNIVSEHFSISNSEILSKKRSKEIVEPRQIVMYLCRKYTDVSYTELGKFFHRDHSTVISGFEKINEELKSNRNLQKNMDILIRKLNNR